MRRILVGYLALCGLLTWLAVAGLDCYATTGTPVPSCADDPSQPQCYPPLTDDMRRDR